MKKIIASAVGLMMAGGIATTASAAVENQFGGYWRTRFIYEENYQASSPINNDSGSVSFVDTRTRLFYTAKFNDDFKFVNKFEFNTGWGDKNGGDIGADGKGNWRVKNSYADWNMGTVNTKVGIQSAIIARGFIFDDDFSGVVVTPKFGNVTVPLVWINSMNKETWGWDGSALPTVNENIFAALAAVKISDTLTVTPYFVWQNISSGSEKTDFFQSGDNWYLGADVDAKFGSVNVWGSGIYEGGTLTHNNVDYSISSFLVAAGADAGIVHGQAFYASGDDDAKDKDINTFISAPGRQAGNPTQSFGYGSSYYWAEILGFGALDDINPAAHTTGDDISNIWAANIGVTLKPMDKVKVDFDVWYAQLAQDNAAGNNELGVEFDAKLTYTIMENLTAEPIFAYLISGDAVGDEDIIEAGMRISLKF